MIEAPSKPEPAELATAGAISPEAAGAGPLDRQTIAAALDRMGLLGPGETPGCRPLEGGVSSEIWLIELPGRRLCLKRALPRLRVAQLWEAPVIRNHHEAAWFRVAGQLCKEAVPKLLGEDPANGLFAMEYLDPGGYPVWKYQLRDGQADPASAVAVGARLARIHAATSGDSAIAQAFATDNSFHALRIEPYLIAASRAHPDLAGPLGRLAQVTADTRRALVHGDVSPKNILIGPRGPVFLDAECAWYGDPAFDVAFCLNHLLLKCLWTPAARGAFLDCFDALSAAYLARVPFEKVERRTATLLPALLLARVDGKSPVEYLTDAQRQLVRGIARELIPAAASLEHIRHAWQKSST